MDWLILILGVPAILIPLVLLFGFAGCSSAASCANYSDCPAGTRCIDGACFDATPGEPDPPPPSGPQNLVAVAIDDRSVSLTWINTDPAATDFRIERAPEGGEFAAIPAPADLSPAGATDASGLLEGVTHIYRVRALLEGEVSEPSETASATVFPATPVNLVATPVSFDQIDLSWNNASATATDFSLEHRALPAGAFTEIFRGTGTAFSHPGRGEGTQHEYRVFAIVVDGLPERRSPGSQIGPVGNRIGNDSHVHRRIHGAVRDAHDRPDGRRGILHRPAIEPNAPDRRRHPGAHRSARLNDGQPHARQGHHLPARRVRGSL